MALLNRARMATSTTGTGTVTLGSAVAGFATFAEAGAQNADVLSYVIEDGLNFEIGIGTYTASGTTFSRDTVYLSKISGTAGTSKINLSGSATIFVSALAEELIIGDAGNTDNAIMRANGADGATVQASDVTIDDDGNIATPAGVGIGGATADATNRLSANTPAVLFNRETDHIQVKLNKAAAGDTASFLFQTGFSGRAEIGAIGDDNFQFKTSPDGSVFTTGISVAASNAAVTIGVSLQTPTIELGHASDTTLSRSAAGVMAVEGIPIYPSIPQNSQSAAYTTVLADAQKHILHPTADNNPRTFTIAANASVAYPIGTVITFVNQINTVTIAITSDTLVLAGAGTTGSRTLAANGIATALKLTSTLWIISGVGLT